MLAPDSTVPCAEWTCVAFVEETLFQRCRAGTAGRTAWKHRTEKTKQNRERNAVGETSKVCPPPICPQPTAPPPPPPPPPSTRKTSGLPQCLKWVYGLLVPPFVCSAFSFDLTKLCFFVLGWGSNESESDRRQPRRAVSLCRVHSGCFRNFPPHTVPLPGLRDRCHVTIKRSTRELFAKSATELAKQSVAPFVSHGIARMQPVLESTTARKIPRSSSVPPSFLLVFPIEKSLAMSGVQIR